LATKSFGRLRLPDSATTVSPMLRVLHAFVHLLEWVTALFLGVLTVASVAAFAVALVAEARAHELLAAAGIWTLLDELLVFFVVIELFKMTLAYLQGANIVPVVLETMLVALARKVVVLEVGAPQFIGRSAALGALLVATAIAWYLLARAGPARTRRGLADRERPE